MATFNVVNLEGASVGQIELADEVFGAPVREHLLWEVVVAQHAARRRGTASTKTRAEVAFTGAKMYKQKGTGRARHGSARVNVFVGGGNAHGPKPRSYVQSTPKKVRRAALISALSLRGQQAQLIVVDQFRLGEIKTKRLVEALERLGVQSGLLVDRADNVELIKSARNLPHAKYLAPEGLNVRDVLRYDALVVSADTAKRIEERLLP